MVDEPKRWRVIREDTPNEQASPWREAIGIEEDDEEALVPAIVCWFTRGWEYPEVMVQSVVDQHNAWVDSLR